VIDLKVLDGIIKYLLVTLLILMFAITFLQVVMRYLFLSPLPWAEEAVRFMFVWASFIGAAIGIKEKIHIGINIIVARLPLILQRITSTAVYLLIMWFAYFMITAGWQFTRFTHAQFSPAIVMRMSYVHVAIPVSGALLILYCSLEIIKLWKTQNVIQGE